MELWYKNGKIRLTGSSREISLPRDQNIHISVTDRNLVLRGKRKIEYKLHVDGRKVDTVLMD